MASRHFSEIQSHRWHFDSMALPIFPPFFLSVSRDLGSGMVLLVEPLGLYSTCFSDLWFMMLWLRYWSPSAVKRNCFDEGSEPLFSVDVRLNYRMWLRNYAGVVTWKRQMSSMIYNLTITQKLVVSDTRHDFLPTSIDMWTLKGIISQDPPQTKNNRQLMTPERRRISLFQRWTPIRWLSNTKWSVLKSYTPEPH